MSEIGVVYTARGLDPNWQARIERFIESYLRHPPGVGHRLYILYKNFATPEDLKWACVKFEVLSTCELFNHLDSKTLAGCTEVRADVTEPILCHLNSSSEIMHADWLKKLYDVFNEPDVGLVLYWFSRCKSSCARYSLFGS